MDCISITNFKLTLCIGIYDWERTHPQTVSLDMTLFPAQPTEGDLQPALDYADVCTTLHHTFNQQSIGLIETLAEQIADYLLTRYPLAKVRLTLHKNVILPGSPDAVSLTIERG